MGSKTAILLAALGDPRETLRALPRLDRAAARRLVEATFPDESWGDAEDAAVGDLAIPPPGVVYAASMPAVSIVCADWGVECGSQLDPCPLVLPGGWTFLVQMHSVVDWFSFAVWADGELVRSLSLSPDGGVVEDFGDRLPFEKPFWDGEHAVEHDEDEDEYPLPFHPLELGEEALYRLFGFHIEGELTEIDPLEIQLAGFRRPPSSMEAKLAALGIR